MSDDLSEIDERLQIAGDDIVALGAQIRAFLAEAVENTTLPPIGLYALARPPQGDTPVRILARVSKPTPTAIRVKAGQVINEIRTCLDSLASQLAIRNGKSASGVYFPISTSAKLFSEDGLAKIRKLSEEDQQKIIDMKPYKGGADALYALHQIDIYRKHTRLSASAAATGISAGPVAAGPGATVTVANSYINGQHVQQMVLGGKNGNVLPDDGSFVVIATGVPASIALRSRITPMLVYEDPPIAAGGEVISALTTCLNAATRAVDLFR